MYTGAYDISRNNDIIYNIIYNYNVAIISDKCRVKFQLFDSFLGKILQPAILTHSTLKEARSIAFDLKKILPSSKF